MRVLITGSTSQQANPEAHRRSSNFMGLIWEQLRQDEMNHIDWKEPSVTWQASSLELDYDHVFVGMASPLAMGANRVYGALSVIEQLSHSRKLTVVIDQPDPGLLARGLRSVIGNWDSFTKPFFSYRREYDLAREPVINRRLHAQVEKLAEGDWPTIVSPAFPWVDGAATASALSVRSNSHVRTLNLDHLLLARWKSQVAPDRSWRLQEWAYERGTDRKWLPGLNLAFPVRELKSNHRIATDPRHAAQLRESIGLLVEPCRGETWWTPKAAMSLAKLTPVFTDWSRAGSIGPEWTKLPGTHEVSRPEEAEELAREQYVSYARSIPGPSEARQALIKAAGIKPVRPRKVVL